MISKKEKSKTMDSAEDVYFPVTSHERTVSAKRSVTMSKLTGTQTREPQIGHNGWNFTFDAEEPEAPVDHDIQYAMGSIVARDKYVGNMYSQLSRVADLVANIPKFNLIESQAQARAPYLFPGKDGNRSLYDHCYESDDDHSRGTFSSRTIGTILDDDDETYTSRTIGTILDDDDGTYTSRTTCTIFDDDESQDTVETFNRVRGLLPQGQSTDMPVVQPIRKTRMQEEEDTKRQDSQMNDVYPDKVMEEAKRQQFKENEVNLDTLDGDKVSVKKTKNEHKLKRGATRQNSLKTWRSVGGVGFPTYWFRNNKRDGSDGSRESPAEVRSIEDIREKTMVQEHGGEMGFESFLIETQSKKDAFTEDSKPKIQSDESIGKSSRKDSKILSFSLPFSNIKLTAVRKGKE